MKQGQHTPAPICRSALPSNWNTREFGFAITTPSGEIIGFAKSESDAQLWKTAPDLLAALDALLGEYSKGICSLPIVSPRRIAWNKAMVAIAKAKGE